MVLTNNAKHCACKFAIRCNLTIGPGNSCEKLMVRLRRDRQNWEKLQAEIMLKHGRTPE